MDITVKYLNDMSVLSINDDDTVYNLKEMISNKYIYPNIDSIRLIYDGQVLENKKKINQYDIDLNKIIHIVLPYHKYNLDDDSDLDSLEDEDFSENTNENSLFNLNSYQSSGFNQMLFSNIINQLNANNTSNIQFDFQFNNNQDTDIPSQESTNINDDNYQQSDENNLSDSNPNNILQNIHNDEDSIESNNYNNDDNNDENMIQSNNNQSEPSTNNQNIPNNLNNTDQINNIQNQMNTLLQNMMNNSTILNNYNTNMYQEEITTLNEMGFNDNNLNRMVLNQTNGNLELAIEILFNY